MGEGESGGGGGCCCCCCCCCCRRGDLPLPSSLPRLLSALRGSLGAFAPLPGAELRSHRARSRFSGQIEKLSSLGAVRVRHGSSSSSDPPPPPLPPPPVRRCHRGCPQPPAPPHPTSPPPFFCCCESEGGLGASLRLPSSSISLQVARSPSPVLSRPIHPLGGGSCPLHHPPAGPAPTPGCAARLPHAICWLPRWAARLRWTPPAIRGRAASTCTSLGGVGIPLPPELFLGWL